MDFIQQYIKSKTVKKMYLKNAFYIKELMRHEIMATSSQKKKRITAYTTLSDSYTSSPF